MAKHKRKIKSPRLKKWLGVVKKHGGDMVAAAKEWKKVKVSGVNPRRRAKGLMPEHQRRAVIRGLARTAAKELSGRGAVMAGRRRNQAVPKPQWRSKWEKATGLKMKATKKLKTPTVPAWYKKLVAGTKGKGKAFATGLATRKKRPSKKKGTGRAWRSGILAAARKAGHAAAKRKPAKKVAANPLGTVAWRSSLVSGLRRAGASPKFISQVQKGLKSKAAMNMVNAVALNQAPVVGTLKQLLSVEAFKDYGFVGTGFVAGMVFPTLATKGLAKLGVVADVSGTVVQVLLGIGGSLAAAVLTGAVTKDANRAQQVAAGGFAGVLGGLAVQQIERLLPMAGLGQDAEAAVEAAVEAELRRELGPGVSGSGQVGQFVTEADVERELAGVGQFVELPDVEAAPVVAGMGAEAGEDIEEVADAFGYAD